jgi:predicted acylesterase/phospholipase RssA
MVAHVGVERWFEEQRIPIDLGAGTSMGGLIGGAFCSGMSAEELAEPPPDLEYSGGRTAGSQRPPTVLPTMRPALLHCCGAINCCALVVAFCMSSLAAQTAERIIGTVTPADPRPAGIQFTIGRP